MSDNYYPINNVPTTTFALDEAGTANQDAQFALPEDGTGGGEKIKSAAVFVSLATITAGIVTVNVRSRAGYDGPDMGIIGTAVLSAVGGYLIPLDRVPFTRHVVISVVKSGGGGAATATGQGYLCFNDGPACSVITDWA